LAGDIDFVLLVGGMSRIPYVAQRLGAFFPTAAIFDDAGVPPEEAVVAGLCDPAGYDRITLHRPGFDLVLDTSFGRVAAYEAYTPLYEPWQVYSGHSALGYERRLRAPEIPSHGFGTLRAVGGRTRRRRCGCGSTGSSWTGCRSGWVRPRWSSRSVVTAGWRSSTGWASRWCCRPTAGRCQDASTPGPRFAGCRDRHRYSLRVTRKTPTLVAEFDKDAVGVVLGILREVEGPLGKKEILARLADGGVDPAVAEKDWRRVQEQIRFDDHVIYVKQTYQWTAEIRRSPSKSTSTG
jgi:hypothetical protein